MTSKTPIKLTNESVVDLSPVIKDAEAKKLLPTNYKPVKYSIDIEGVSTAVVNGIRRTLYSEMPVLAMNFRDEDFQSNNPFIIIDMIRQRIRQIPIDQSVNENTTFNLNVSNKDLKVAEVKSGDIKMLSGNRKLPFNETFTICTLEPETKISIGRIYVERGLGYQWAGFSVAFNTAVVPLDQTPVEKMTSSYNNYSVSNDGISSSVSDPRKHRLLFTTNGTMQPRDIVKSACENLIGRLMRILDIIDNTISSVGNHTLLISSETDTIGNILMKTICELNPDIGFCTYLAETTARECTLRIKTDGDAKSIIEGAVRVSVEQIKKIMGELT